MSDAEAAWSMRHGLVAGLSLAGWGVASVGGEEEEKCM